MNATPRIVMLKKLEPKLNRTEFKVIFALSITETPLSKKEISTRTGLSEPRINEAIESLMMHNIVDELNGKYFYSDHTEKWKLDMLNSRQLGVPAL
jgi:predicted transcriptional regulator